MKLKQLPTQERLREVLGYDPDTGVLTWRVPHPGVPVGSKAGHFNGCRRVDVDGVKYIAHRLIFVWMTGNCPGEVDHKDGDPSNNRWSNLRECSHAQNQRNVKRHRDNVTGFKGVSRPKRGNRFHARIMFNGKTKSIGYFLTAEEAHAAYCQVAQELHGEFAR